MRATFILLMLASISIKCDSFKYAISSCIFSRNDNIVTFKCSDYKNDGLFHASTTYHCNEGDTDFVFNKADIRKVAFQDCDLQHIPRELYEEYSGIEVLNISGLGLKWLYLEEARSVVNVLASHNKLRIIPQYLGEIEEIDLSMNEIDEEAVHESKVIEFLRTFRENLFMKHENVYKWWQKIEYLKFFSGVNKVKNLNLSNNNFHKLNAGIFEKFTELQHLNLSYNRIKEIEPMTLAHQIKLQTLDLSKNMIESLSDKIFAFQSKHLKLLLIEGNNLLQVVSGFTKSNYPTLVIVSTKENKADQSSLEEFN